MIESLSLPVEGMSLSSVVTKILTLLVGCLILFFLFRLFISVVRWVLLVLLLLVAIVALMTVLGLLKPPGIDTNLANPAEALFQIGRPDESLQQLQLPAETR